MEPREPRPLPDYRDTLRAYQAAVDRFVASPTGAHVAAIIEQEARLIDALLRPGRFALGRTVATPGAIEALQRGLHIAPEFLLRHKSGDWGELDEEDIQANEDALRHGSRILSAYTTRRSERLWVITEWDRSATTILLPVEY
jgi:hypothetical protein